MKDLRAASLGDRATIVTGAGSGIGQAAALAFARAGSGVALVGRRREPLEDTAREIEAAGGAALVLTGDVSSAAEAEAIVSRAADHFGRLDHLFNNAGIQGPTTPIVDMAEDDFDAVIAINLKGPWLMTRAALRVMLAASRAGAIVNTSSFLSVAATAGSAAYSASKAGLDAMIRALALEAGPYGIRINNISPGVIDTPMLRKHGADIIPPLAARAALGRIGKPEDIADVAVWLCTDDARFVTGQSLLVDGGFAISGPR